MIDDAEYRAWAYLARVAEPPSGPLAALVAELGAVDAAAAVRRRRVPAGFGEVLKATAARADTDSSAQDIEIAHRIGARLLTPDDDEWPALALYGLDHATERGGAPLALWVRGPGRLDDVAAHSIALVGARAASTYGAHVTEMLADRLVGKGWAIVSGAAYGIDAAAHRSALAADGTTMAVLACGIDRDYPAGNARLLDEIAARGLIVSEYPPGTTAARHRFLTRNRLVAALSSAVIVVEAGVRSGAASTAAWARKLDRPLGAVPGPVTSATSVGCHRLISDDLAVLVADADAASALASPDGGGDPGRGPDRPTDALTVRQRRVHDAIPGSGAVTIDEIAYAAGLTVAEVRPALAVMELGGLVSGDGGTWRLCRSA
ncbi:MAG: DNA-processing protein DprA [Gordonia sp. (in: high G+C Gram-positive bacteria)]